MSSRVRILFYGGKVGGQIGLKALASLEKVYQDATKARQAPMFLGEWRDADMLPSSPDRKDPHLTENRVARNGGVLHVWQVPVYTVVELPPPPPEGLKGIERAKFLWNALPQHIRNNYHFSIVREGRARDWHKQQTNPWLHGCGKVREKRKQPQRQRHISWTFPPVPSSLIETARANIRRRNQEDDAPPPRRMDGPEVPEAPRMRIGIWA